MSLNMELVKAVREAQHAAEKAANDYTDISRRYKLTPEGALQEGARLGEAARSEADNAKLRGFAAIDAKCAELDAQEQAAAEKRAGDTAYWQRLELKLHIFAGVDADSMTDEAVKAFFAEFAGDSIAVAAIKKAIDSPMRASIVAPEDTNGKRQRHLKEIVKPSFERTMNKAGAGDAVNPYDIANGAIFGLKSEIDAFCAYCTAQDEDFSKDDAEIWDEVRGRQNVPSDGAFAFNFEGVRKR